VSLAIEDALSDLKVNVNRIPVSLKALTNLIAERKQKT